MRAMKIRSGIFVFVALLVVIIARIYDQKNLYQFEHPRWLDIGFFVLLAILSLTHIFIAVVMLVQREEWVPSEAAMFRFICIKTIFWSNATIFYPFEEKGARLDLVVLFVLLLLTTIDLDYRMINRYIFGVEDDHIFGRIKDTRDP